MNNQKKNTIVLTEAAIRRRKGMVVLPLPQYERIKEENIRMRQLIGEWEKREKEEIEALNLIEQGEKEYREGKIKPIKSLKELRRLRFIPPRNSRNSIKNFLY